MLVQISGCEKIESAGVADDRVPPSVACRTFFKYTAVVIQRADAPLLTSHGPDGRIGTANIAADENQRQILSSPHKVVKISTYFCLRRRIRCGPLGGSEGVMPNRANSFASALLGSVLTGAVLFGLNVTASAASECLESPNQRTTQPGHWYFHFDRTLNRRCWFFQPSEARSSDVRSSEVRSVEATASPPAAAPPAAAYQDSQQSLLSRFAAGFSQPYSSQPQQTVPQQYTIPEEPAEAPKTASPKPPRASKVSRREHERLQTASPATGGADGQDQSQQPAPVAEKNEKPAMPLDVVEREALYQNFMKWQRDRTVFGERW
jgi:hypothetical protein